MPVFVMQSSEILMCILEQTWEVCAKQLAMSITYAHRLRLGSWMLLAGKLCELYSDIALLDTCPENQVKTSVHIGLSYRERDAFVAAKDQCFVEFEDIALIGCYGPSFPTDSFNLTNSLVTPHHCQQHCRALDAPYYAVSDGTDCYCSSSSSFYSDLALSSSNCTTPCDGDPSQVCSAQ